MSQPQTRDLTQLTLAILFIGCLGLSTFLVVQPFIAPLIWAGMITIASWPLMLRLQKLMFGKRWLAILVVTGALLILLIIPLWLAISGVVRNSTEIGDLASSLTSAGIPPPPVGLQEVPVVGPRLVKRWQELASKDQAELTEAITPYLRRGLSWIVSSAGNLTMLFIHFLVTLIITVLLYASGENVAEGLRKFGRRLGGEKGENVVVLSGQAIRAVALGIIVTSFVQAVMAALGFMLLGIPYAVFLTTLLFLLCVIQIGAWLVLFPVVGWLFYSGSTGWAIAMLVWSILIIGVDNILRPLLIKRGADLPLILIFAGVIGGLLSFGVLGLFIGPVVLAVTYTLLDAWVES